MYVNSFGRGNLCLAFFWAQRDDMNLVAEIYQFFGEAFDSRINSARCVRAGIDIEQGYAHIFTPIGAVENAFLKI